MHTIEIGENSIYNVLCNDVHMPFNDGIYIYKSALHAYYVYLNEGNAKNILEAKTFECLQEQLGSDTYKNASTPINHNRYFNLDKTVSVLRRILLLKMLNNVSVKQALLLTGTAHLMIMNGSDMVLGIGKSRRGYNLTGILWMEMRDALQNGYLSPGLKKI
jgi:hypothetical protein